MSQITVNGKVQELENQLTLSELMILNNVVQPEMVTIQLNGQYVHRDNYQTTPIKSGDEVDFLYFMGGGSI